MQYANGRILLSPSDLNNYVNCRHLTTLERAVVRGELERPHRSDESAKLLQDKGLEHEFHFLQQLHAEGREVVDITMDERRDFGGAAQRTLDAMRAGADVISQATFVSGAWRGRADFLLRTDVETDLGGWGYDALDAKLARAEKPTYVLQLCFYSDAIADIQGKRPEHMHVHLGTGAPVRLRYDDFSAYYRRVRQRFEEAIASTAPTEAWPVEHCALCDFVGVCNSRWRADDHLVQVAGIRRDQVVRLREAGLPTLTALARATAKVNVQRMLPHIFDALRDQALLQLIRHTTGRLDSHAIDCDTGRGFELLPPPSSGDVIFDIEGDPFWEPAQGLHFLFGLLLKDGSAWRYEPVWAHDRAGERAMFEAFVDRVHARLAADPGMHVYHYGTYENAAIKQLMGSYATREDAVDELLRRNVFVNLHTVVRQGLRAGVDKYSLKEVEALARFERQADVRKGIDAVLNYEKWRKSSDDALLSSIADYNAEDCSATLALRDWLVENHPADKSWAAVVEPKDEKKEDDGERNALRQRLIEGEEVGSVRWLAGELLEYHRREARPAWWWYFKRRDLMTEEELLDDAEAISGLTPTGEAVPDKSSIVYTLRFLPQQHKLAAGKTVVDPVTKKSPGTIVGIDDVTGTLKLRRGQRLRDLPLPRAIAPGGPYDTDPQRGALARLATAIADDDDRYPALRDILARTPPRIAGYMPGFDIQTTDLAQQRELTGGLAGSYLFIQGPPGTGKTWTGARLIVDLMRRGRRVGVTATSHKAIHNLLAEVERAAAEEGMTFRGLKKSSDDDESAYKGTQITNEDDIDAFASAGPDVLLFAGTAWLFAHEKLDGTVDTLIIDEAGQVSLADALAMGTAARNIVLLGDPLQLAQVSQGTQPEGTGSSVLEHLLGDNPTIPANMGLFLESTRRMHPDVCRFVSEIVYDGRLHGIPDLATQTTAFGTGLRFLPVEHSGNTSASPEEAAAIVAEIGRMVGASWTDRDGKSAPLQQSDFMVVAPYNAQVRKLLDTLRQAGLGGVEVGTVDKFQGREAPVVFYSMATSSIEDVPRSLEFLFSRNRLNVAVSRAMCLAFVVASPRLLESQARTIDQMRLINALCRFVEMAEEQVARRREVLPA